MKINIIGIIEYLIVFIAVLYIFILKIRQDRKVRKIQATKEKLKTLFDELLIEKTALEKVDWLPSPRDFLPLLIVLEEFTEKFGTDSTWDGIKHHFTIKHLRPWALKHYRSKLWNRRNLSARIFLLFPLPEDLDCICHFLKDRDFYIRMVAVEALGRLKTSAVVPIILQYMAKEPPKARFIYRYALNLLPFELFDIVVDVYKKSKSLAVRLCCLDVLSHGFHHDIYPIVHQSLHSKYPQIRYMVAKILANLRSDKALQDLISLLKDPTAKVRAMAVESLGDFHHEKAFEKVGEMIHDKVYDVRLKAAFAMLKYGKRGIQFLELQDSDLYPKAHEVARFVLTLP